MRIYAIISRRGFSKLWVESNLLLLGSLLIAHCVVTSISVSSPEKDGKRKEE